MAGHEVSYWGLRGIVGKEGQSLPSGEKHVSRRQAKVREGSWVMPQRPTLSCSSLMLHDTLQNPPVLETKAAAPPQGQHPEIL